MGRSGIPLTTDNDDPASIGYNLPDPPTPAEFHQLLTEIAAKPEVGDVRIEMQGLEDEDGWPSTDTIWIATSAGLDTVKTWFPERFAPDDWLTPEGLAEPVEPYDPPPGTQVFCAWYD